MVSRRIHDNFHVSSSFTMMMKMSWVSSNQGTKKLTDNRDERADEETRKLGKKNFRVFTRKGRDCLTLWTCEGSKNKYIGEKEWWDNCCEPWKRRSSEGCRTMNQRSWVEKSTLGFILMSARVKQWLETTHRHVRHMLRSHRKVAAPETPIHISSSGNGSKRRNDPIG